MGFDSPKLPNQAVDKSEFWMQTPTHIRVDREQNFKLIELILIKVVRCPRIEGFINATVAFELFIEGGGEACIIETSRIHVLHVVLLQDNIATILPNNLQRII